MKFEVCRILSSNWGGKKCGKPVAIALDSEKNPRQKKRSIHEGKPRGTRGGEKKNKCFCQESLGVSRVIAKREKKKKITFGRKEGQNPSFIKSEKKSCLFGKVKGGEAVSKKRLRHEGKDVSATTF